MGAQGILPGILGGILKGILGGILQGILWGDPPISPPGVPLAILRVDSLGGPSAWPE